MVHAIKVSKHGGDAEIRFEKQEGKVALQCSYKRWPNDLVEQNRVLESLAARYGLVLPSIEMAYFFYHPKENVYVWREDI